MKSLSLSQPHLLIMVGIPGSGKSFFAEKFSDMFHAPWVSYDKIAEISNDNESSARYMSHLLHELFKTGHTIIVDGLADTRAQRAELKHLAMTAGYKPLFVWVQTDEATAKARKQKTLKGDRHAVEYEYDKLLGVFSAPAANERPLIVISGKHTYATQAKAVLKNLATPRNSTSKSPSAPDRDNHQAASRRNITIQ